MTFGFDELIAELAHGEALAVVLAVALLLGLRHATDPDHLAAVTTLIATEPDEGGRRAARLGLAWGLGHALALAGLGLPIVLFHAYLSDTAQDAAEALVGLMIVVLAVRLLIRWRQGRFRAHPHRYGDLEHSRLQAFGIGLVHGVGGSAGVGVLLLATIPDQATAVAALFVLALGTAASMALLSSAFGYAIAHGPVRGGMPALAPAMGALTLAFGVWYTLGAVGA